MDIPKNEQELQRNRNSQTKFSTIFSRQKPRVVSMQERISDSFGEPENSEKPPVSFEPEIKHFPQQIPQFADLQRKLQDIKNNLTSRTQQIDIEHADQQPSTAVHQVETPEIESSEHQNFKKTPYAQPSVQFLPQSQAPLPQPKPFSVPGSQNAFQQNTMQQNTIQQNTVQQNPQPSQPQPQPQQQQQNYQQQNYQQPQNQPQPTTKQSNSLPKSKCYIVNTQKYMTTKQLGSGGSATVYRAMRTDGSLYALKVVELKGADDELQGENAIRQEINRLEKVKGHGISLDLIGYEFTESNALIVMELGEIDLKNFMRENRILSENRIGAILEDICITVNKIHQLGIIHGDLKPQNFMFSNGRIKLIDFGISKEMVNNETMVIRDSISGTVKYLAPEVINCQYRVAGAKIHRASDIWSIGIIAYELACGMNPFDEIMRKCGGIMPFLDVIRHKNYTIDWNFKCSAQLKDLISKCLEHDDSKRIGINEIMRHDFMK
ncbi:Kinase [Hexamita inflata]|uniref:Kinase n=1 Tax=Hexamita inflata TaxID=28002 RepID=A0AA86NFZ6_9EUKA|nr:Kinase [Hexamita inflata]